MDMVETGHDLVEDALDSSGIHTLVVTGLHELVEVTIHVLHADVKFSAQRVEEDVESGNKMGMRG